MKAEPNCNLQEMLPVSLTARFAVVPKKTPQAVHICQHTTRPPRTEAGAFSAQKIGTVDALELIPCGELVIIRFMDGQAWIVNVTI
jgi:hypothetical protein